MTPQVIVIGAGAAGLMAAISAREAGAAGHACRAHCRRRPQDPHQRRRSLQRAAVNRRARAFRQRIDGRRCCAACSAPGPSPAQQRFFERDLGIALALEDGSGKLFPVSNRARDVRDGLVARARAGGVGLRFGRRSHRGGAARRDVAGAHGGRRAGGHARGHRHRWLVGAEDRQRRLRPGPGARARPRRATDLRGADAAHRQPAAHATLSGVSLAVRIEVSSVRERARAAGGFLVHAPWLQRAERARRVPRPGAQSVGRSRARRRARGVDADGRRRLAHRTGGVAGPGEQHRRTPPPAAAR